ncbi:MAG: zinc ribbon domain-containing protein [Verrucomicrobia bacterium]|nr:zinc ribbon domain-containing protein [Verrucomicrobiota bacterium]
MPSYDYYCRKCGKKFTLTMTMSDHEKKKVKCPKCSSSQVAQQVGAFFATTSKKS